MTQSRERIVERVTAALTGDPAPIAIHHARKIDARGVADPFWIVSDGGVIVATGTDEEAFESACRSVSIDPAAENAIIDANGRLLTPGYVDIHAHGAWEHSFDDGPSGIDVARAGHAVHGTTRQVLSLITNPIDVMCANLRNVRAKMDERPDVLARIWKARSSRSRARARTIPNASRTRCPSSWTSCWRPPPGTDSPPISTPASTAW